MARALTRHRIVAGLAVLLPFAAFLPAACGGTDTIPFDDDAATAADGPRPDTSTDTSLSDTSTDTSLSDTSTDTRLTDSATDARLDSSSDTSVADTSVADTSVADTSVADTSVADTSVADTSVVDAGVDARDAADARDSSVVANDARLGSMARFTVFAGSTVTNAFGTLTTITRGDLGTYPSPTAIGVTPPVLVGGAFHLGDGVAAIAANDLIIAYDNLTPAKMPGCTVMTGVDLGGKTLPPGIYCFATSAQLTGALVLDSGGNPNAEWFFQIGSTLTTGPIGATPASVTVVGGNPCRAYWQVGSSATLGTGTSFSGNILAAAAITLVTGTTVTGRALAVNAAVTMDTNSVSTASCP